MTTLSREDVQWQRAEAQSVRVTGGQTVSLAAVLATPADLGRGIVRIHPDAARQLGVSDGDVLALERPPSHRHITTKAPRSGLGQPADVKGVPSPQTSSGAKTGAAPTTAAFGIVVVDPAINPAHAALDGLQRRATGIGLGEAVTLCTVRPGQALAVKAERSSLAPALKSSELASLLDGMVAAPGSFLQPSRGHLLRVTGTTPEGPVRLNASTLVQADQAPAARGFTDTGVWYEDVGGLDTELARVREIVELPLLRPELFLRLGVVPPKGVLLHGAPGTGKTLLARAVANECRAAFLHINGPDLMHKFYGESEQRLKQLFEDAAAQAPSIIFIDEIDAIAPKRAEVLGEMEKRVVAQFLALMDGFVNRGQVVVIGATNLPQALDPALRRPGRFDREIEIGQPDRSARLAILRIHTRSMPLALEVDLPGLADRTPGFVGADLEALCQEAGMAAIRRLTASESGVRSQESLGFPTPHPRLPSPEEIGAADFLEAFHAVEPTAAREIVREQTRETFASVGGYESLKGTLRTIFSRAGLSRGALLQGPSGVGKTLLARSLAGELKLPLIAVDGPLLYSKWLGESEKALADVFAKARHNAPCLLLLDQLEAVGDSRLESATSGRMVGQLLRELDELAAFPEVALIGATNRPELVDPAVKRRFDYAFELPLPDEDDREAIWHVHLDQPSLAATMAKRSHGFSGSDIAAAVRRARLFAIERAGHEPGQNGTALNDEITINDLEKALCLK